MSTFNGYTTPKGFYLLNDSMDIRNTELVAYRILSEFNEADFNSLVYQAVKRLNYIGDKLLFIYVNHDTLADALEVVEGHFDRVRLDTVAEFPHTDLFAQPVFKVMPEVPFGVFILSQRLYTEISKYLVLEIESAERKLKEGIISVQKAVASSSKSVLIYRAEETFVVGLSSEMKKEVADYNRLTDPPKPSLPPEVFAAMKRRTT